MSTPARIVLTILFTLSLVVTSMAQTSQTDGQATAPIVTATASTSRVRYVSVGEVERSRLQVFSIDGAQVFDSGFRLGNLINWPLQDQQGLRLSAGTYLCLVTVKDFSERSTQKYGSAVLDQEQVYLEQTSIDSLTQAQTAALEANRNAETLSAVDRIGVTALNSSMTDSTSDGTTSETQPSGIAGSSAATDGDNISGTGTQNYLSKWIDNAGTLGDSILFESATGRIGLGTTSPGAKFHVVGAQGSIGGGTFQLDTPTPFSVFTGAYPAFEIINTNPTNNNVSLFQFADAPSGAAHAGIGAVNTNHASDFGNLFFFTKAAADGYGVRMGVYGSNVGIGTTAPNARLWVENGGGGLPTLVASSFNSTGVGGVFQILNATNPDSVLQSFTSGLGRAGSFQVGNSTNNANALNVDTNGTGRAGFFQVGNASNNRNALEVTTNGTGFAAFFEGSGPSSDGVQITAGDGEIGLEITNGRVVLSYASVADGGTIPFDVAVVNVPDDGAGTQPSVALPASSENGTVIVVATTDSNGAQITGASGGPHTITAINSRRFIRAGGVWKSEL